MQFLGQLTGLIQNIALVLSLTLVYSVVRPHWVRRSPYVRALVAGTLFGVIAIASMHTPIIVVPGVIADARVIPVLLAGPFGGAGEAIIAAVIAAAYRVSLAGAGMWAGVGTILTAGALGVFVAWRWHGRERELKPGTFLVLGLLLDAQILVWARALPSAGLAREVLAAAAVPIGLYVPAATVLLGMLLTNAIRRHDEQERLRLTQFSLERSAEALFWIEADGRLVYANQAAETLTGYTRSALRRLRVWSLDADGGPDAWRTTWTEAREGKTRAAERRFRHRDGHVFPVEISLDFVEHRGQEWISVFARDISDRKRLDDERTEHLATERSLRERAEEANVLRDQFLALLSHELRTPLTSIVGYARLLRQQALEGRSAERAIEVIDRCASAEMRIVEDLLDVSSMVLGTLQMDREAVALGAIVETEVEAVQSDAARERMTVRCEIDTRSCPVNGDARRLQQVVRNLLSNALKFTPAGGTITVRLSHHGREARLVVSDTGCGIEPTFLPHVFDRLRQADGSITRAHEGLGLGLAIVRHVVEQHGGRVWAESDGVGRGAALTVVLPLSREAVAA